MKRIIIGIALVLVGYGLGQTFGPPSAAAGSVDEIVSELRFIRRAIERINRDCG